MVRLYVCTEEQTQDMQQVARYKPESLDNLSSVTNFSKKELRIMYRGFKQVGVWFV